MGVLDKKNRLKTGFWVKHLSPDFLTTIVAKI
jgi:hypothetical protein